MSRANLHATSALGLCLGLLPLSGAAQSASGDAQDADMFVSLVRACVAAPSVENCEPVRAVVAECANDLDYARCELLFEDGGAIFDDPARLERAQAALSLTAEAIASMDFAEFEGELAEVARADAERAMIRGDGNLLTHSTPPLIVSDAPPPDDDDASLAADDAAAAGTAAAEDADTLADPVPGDAAPEPRPERLTGENAAPAPAPSEEVGTEAVTAPAERPLTDDEAQSVGEAAAGPDQAVEPEVERVEAEAPDAEGRQREADARALEEERARLRAMAEDMAAEAPALVVEEVAEETVVAEPDAPRELDERQRSALERLLQQPEIAAAIATLGGVGVLAGRQGAQDGAADSPVAAQAAPRRDDAEDDAIGAAEAEEVIEDTFTAAEVRGSRDDFDSRLALDFDADQPRDDGRRRNLERAGLAALGALAVGMIVDRNRVVARSDERVVVQDDAGQYAVWRDDDAILRQEGSQRRVERFSDGSSLTRWRRDDDTQIITIRDATGRVLRRERVLADGTSIFLVDDMREVEPIDVAELPPLRIRELRISQRTDPELALALLTEAEADARAVDRAFSLQQVRQIREVRELAPLLSPDPITFETNRARVRPEEAPKLAQVGRLMERL
ncbi:hypothetical protein, partial [Rubrimonas sp.]|uniref:hypothetical protein n=1 Tax=Rubrimonas sp. TaxID=2036015 RepID=UPI002FDD4BB4